MKKFKEWVSVVYLSVYSVSFLRISFTHYNSDFFVERMKRAVKLLNSNELFSCVNHYNLQMDSDLLIQELQKKNVIRG